MAPPVRLSWPSPSESFYWQPQKLESLHKGVLTLAILSNWLLTTKAQALGPMQKGASEKKLKAGEIVPIDIELYPGNTFLPAETLQLIIAFDEIIPSPP